MDRVGDPSSPRDWRLIESGPGEGAFNMALDIAIQSAHADGIVPPTFRLYTWLRPTLSLGRFQDAARGVDLGACAELGVDVVRRPTGGRAILHTDDVTYSVVCRADLLESGQSVVGSYKEITRGVRNALALLGVRGDLARSPTEEKPARAADCFASASLADLVVDGTKIVGSAQCRRSGVILQQGTIPLGPKLDALADVFTAPLERRRPANAGLSGAAGRPIGQAELLRALRSGFGKAICGRLKPGTLTKGEMDQARRLERGVSLRAGPPLPVLAMYAR
jgi:lipoate-protein ligase A